MHFVRLMLVTLFTCATVQVVHAATLTDISQLYKKGKSDQALTELNTYLAALPKGSWGRNVTQARFLRGLILAEQKHTEEAIKIFNQLTLDYPALPEPYNNLAALYVSQGKYEAARDTLERAMHIDPTYATLQANLGDVYAKLSAQAYESTLTGSSNAAPERIRELCENYGKMANQVAGRKVAAHTDADFRLIKDIQPSRTAAAQPPAHVDIDEMAMDSAPSGNTVTASPQLPSPKPLSPGPERPSAQPPTIQGDMSKEKSLILKVVHSWSQAWSSKNVSGYLGFYTRNFKPPGVPTHAAWAAQRRERITRPKSIRVIVEAPQVDFSDSTHARVTFKQSYRSDTLQTTAGKTLVMTKTGGHWLIDQELAGG